MKLIFKFICIAAFPVAVSATPQTSTSAKPVNNYQSEADSLRKQHLTPGNDSSKPVNSHKMPVAKPSDNHDPNMPVGTPDSKDRMPVKELSDTSKVK